MAGEGREGEKAKEGDEKEEEDGGGDVDKNACE